MARAAKNEHVVQIEDIRQLLRRKVRMSRLVTIASVSHSPGPELQSDLQKLLDQATQYVQRAVRLGADIVAFPEVYPHLGYPAEKWPEIAEELPGPTTSRMAEVAADNNCYLIWPLVERQEDQLHNTAVLLDRQGQIAGKYRKMYLTIGEMEGGIIPGTEATVLETDFGQIGIAICFDLNWRAVMTGLKENGAEVIFFCSMYRGSLQLRAWALELGCYLVSAIAAELGMIVDLTGQVLKTSHQDVVIAQQINLNRRLLHMDYNWDKMDEILAKYGPEVSFDYAAPEGRFALGCRRPGLSVEDLIDEFGLERLEDYWARCLRVREQVLRGEGAS